MGGRWENPSSPSHPMHLNRVSTGIRQRGKLSRVCHTNPRNVVTTSPGLSWRPISSRSSRIFASAGQNPECSREKKKSSGSVLPLMGDTANLEPAARCTLAAGRNPEGERDRCRLVHRQDTGERHLFHRPKGDRGAAVAKFCHVGDGHTKPHVVLDDS